MKVWKLVSGILCIIFAAVVIFQSCAANVVNALEENASDTSAAGGILLAILILTGGIVSIATRKSGKGSNIPILIIFAISAIIGFANLGTYKDLIVWAIWCVICAVMALIGILVAKKPVTEEKNG